MPKESQNNGGNLQAWLQALAVLAGTTFAFCGQLIENEQAFLAALASVCVLVAMAIWSFIRSRRFFRRAIIRTLHRAYREDSLQEWGQFRAWFAEEGESFPLGEIYVPTRLSRTTSPSDAISLEDEFIAAFESERPLRRIILGAVGMGKSMLLQHLAYWAVQECEELGARHKKSGCLVVKLNCREISTQAGKAGDSTEISGLWAAIRKSIERSLKTRSYWFRLFGIGKDEAIEIYFTDVASSQVLLLLDGFDEVSDDDSAESDAQKLMRHLKEFISDVGCGSKRHILITCRDTRFRKGELDFLGAKSIAVDLFSPDDVRRHLESWPKLGERFPTELLAHLDTTEGATTAEICRTPLLLSLLIGTSVRAKDGALTLPRTRLDFYKSIVDELLDARPTRRAESPESEAQVRIKEAALQIVARRRFDKRTRSADREMIPEQDLREAISDQATKVGFTQEQDVNEALRALVKKHGILCETRMGAKAGCAVYSFPHRSFLEYFAAIELTESMSVARYTSREKYVEVEEFFGVTLWYCTLGGHKSDSAQDCVRSIVGHYLQVGDHLKAARCLFWGENWIDNPDIVSSVVDQLPTDDSAIQWLGQLSMVTSPAFSPAREAYMRAFDSLLGNAPKHKASSLLRLLKGNEVLGMQVIEVLLSGPPTVWSSAAVETLGTHGTAGAMKLLTRTLNKPAGDPLRILAAEEICSLLERMTQRGASAYHSAVIHERDFPRSRPDPSVWPLHALLSSSIVMPLIQSFPDSRTTNVGFIPVKWALEHQTDNNVWSDLYCQFQSVREKLSLLRSISRCFRLLLVVLLVSSIFSLLLFHSMRRWYVIDLSRGISQLPVSDVAVVFDARDRCGRIGETLDANVRKEPIVSLIYDPLGRSNGRRIVRYEARPSETQEGVYQKLAFRRDNISIQDIAALDLTESDQRGAEELGVGFKEFQELVSKVKKAQAIISSRAKEFEQFSIPPTWAWDYQYTRELAFVMSFAGGILIALSVKLAHLISKRIWNAEAAPIAEIGVGLTLWIALCLFNRGEMLIRAIPLIFLVGPVFVLQVARLTILSRFPLFSFCNEVERIGMVLRERESTTPDSRGAGK